MTLELKEWQQELLLLLENKGNEIKDRGVIWIQDLYGGAGKSTFIRYLISNKELKVAKLPMDSTDRIRSALINIAKKDDIDIFVFDFTRTRGKDTHIENLFEVVEEIKNGLVVDVMYGKYRTAFLDYPHVIIFTNENIKDYRQYLSADRWYPFSILNCEPYGLAYIDAEDNRIPFAQYSEKINTNGSASN